MHHQHNLVCGHLNYCCTCISFF